MKWKTILIVTAFAGLSTTVMASEKEPGLLQSLLGAEAKARTLTQGELDTALSVKDLLGTKVVNPQGDTLGKVVDLTLKDKQGEFQRVIVSVGGLWGLGDVLVAVPYDQIQHKQGTRNLIWDIPKSKFHTLVEQGKNDAQTSAKLQDDGHGKGARQLVRNQSSQSAKASKSQDPDIQKARDALKSNNDLSIQLDNLKLSKSDGKLVIEGTPSNTQQKNKIINTIRNATDCEIEDKMTVQ